ncbi:MAG TPA: thiamine-phosphate kinase [Pyrinomonadaceae bacterium]|nr:thiamine-phosphate kinase [Pyrinomonadaceae bacterium]
MKDEAEAGQVEESSPEATKNIRSEFDFINSIRHRSPRHRQTTKSPPAADLLTGIGDDAAIIRETDGRNTLITSDLLIEDIDFHRDTTTPRSLGHKALAVSLSDIAGMGARPRWALLSLGIPNDIWNSDFVDEFYEGFFALADRYDVSLIGGDISRSPEKLVVDSIVLGQSDHGRAVTRGGTKPGDQIFVTGSLGGSAAGLRLLTRGARLHSKHTSEDQIDPDSKAIDHLILRHIRPEPRVGWGLVLGLENLATAMIDISDGLSSDLHHLCAESKAGALVQAARIPIDPTVAEICGRRALDPLLLALHGGEDFELLFTVAPEKVALLPKKVDGVAITHIGEIQNTSAGVQLAEGARIWKLEPEGWQHF